MPFKTTPSHFHIHMKHTLHADGGNSSCTDLAAVTFQIQDVVEGRGGVEMNHVTVDSGEHVTPMAEHTLRTHKALFPTLLYFFRIVSFMCAKQHILSFSFFFFKLMNM